MQSKIKNGLEYVSCSINEYKDLYANHKWTNLITAKNVFYSLGLTSDLLSFPQSQDIDFLNFSVCELVSEKADQYIGTGVCMREEIKMEYVGYSALLITYYWYHHNGNYSLENVPYLCDGNFSDFKERVLNYIGASVSDKPWIKRAISDCAHDFYQKELKHNTRQLPDGPYLSPAGREIAWDEASEILFQSCHVLEMQRLGFE